MKNRQAELHINPERLLRRLQLLGEIGRQPSGGVTRLALTPEDEAAIALVEQFMLEAGLTVRRDAAGNLIGRREGGDPAKPAVLTGSHIDTVVDGGIYDGCLGVLGGIEAVQTMNERGIRTAHAIEVNVYRDEEGVRFRGIGLSGSRGMTSGIDPDRLVHTDADGVSIADALRAVGFDPARIREAVRPKGSVKAHVELHIEQGKVLEVQGAAVGIVTGICCASRCRVVVTGEAGHAGTTPMLLRRDPLAATAEIMSAIEEESLRTGTTVGTVGQLRVFPGAVNVIPGKVAFSIDIRDMDHDVLGAVVDKIAARAGEICERRGMALEFEVLGKGKAKPCAPSVQQTIDRAVRSLGHTPFYLPSGAGHDSGAFADFCPMGMIFVRSRLGISHNPAEWSSPEDCADGTETLYRTLLELAVPASDDEL